MTPDPSDISCILGRCDSLRAEVFFRAALPPGVVPSEAVLAGTLVGPDCKHAITLPVTTKLTVARGGTESVDAATLVARAILTEPSFWTPELPSLYRLDARLVAAGREVATWRQPVGLRRLGVRGRSLWLDGRRYVPRGLVAAADDLDIAAFRAAGLAAVVADPTEALLDRCDAEGVAVIGLLAEASGQSLAVAAATATLARWAWHPAVLAAVVPRTASAEAAAAIAAAVRGRRDTVLLAREVDGSEPPVEVAAGIDLLVVALPVGGTPHDDWRTAPPPGPVLARRAGEPGPEPSRRGCDALQAALAAWRAGGASGQQSDWAGYLVG